MTVTTWRDIERSLIDSAEAQGIEMDRDDGEPGIWFGRNSNNPRFLSFEKMAREVIERIVA